jgi:hypothetical protein
MAVVMAWLKRALERWRGSLKSARLLPAPSSRFRAGQVWRYRCRPGEDGSRAIVGRVEAVAGGQIIVHVQLVGLNVRNPDAPSGRSAVIQHSPVAELQVAQSVVGLESEDGLVVGFDEGYAMWRQGFEAGNAGVFTVPLAEVVSLIEQTLGSGRGAAQQGDEADKA